MNILFVGGGNMATALIGGLLQQGFRRTDIRVAEVKQGARAALKERLEINAAPGIPPELSVDEIVVLAVKPQQVQDVAGELMSRLANQLVVTIAAGISTTLLSRWLGGHARIVRVMPNTPAMIRAGVSALFAMPSVPAHQREQAQEVLSAVGPTLWVEREELMDAVTAVSGSGPAYVFYFMEAVMAAASRLGLSEEQARLLTLETFFGAASLARQSAEPPALLRARVTSKGGTTERAIGVLDAAGVRDKMIDAVCQAAQRSRELGQDPGR
jgi:pyrroline-5-carboxylate reductase